jgi:hypothetical protein
MKKDNLNIINIIISISILIVGIVSVNLALESLKTNQVSINLSNESLQFNKAALEKKARVQFINDVEEVNGNYLDILCEIRGCKLDVGDEIAKSEDYYLLRTFVSNNGDRINNVYLEYYCENIDFYGILGTKKIDVKEAYDFRTKIYFPLIDSVNYYAWDTIFKVRTNIQNFTCYIEYVSDELESKKEDIIVNLK